MTTGATAGACARALLRAGATSVHVLTWARALPFKTLDSLQEALRSTGLHARSLLMATVEIYTKMLCTFCTRAKKLLASKGDSYKDERKDDGAGRNVTGRVDNR